MKRRHCPTFVTKLEKNQVFCFGSNNLGVHGAGSAGFAQYGTTNPSPEQRKVAYNGPKMAQGSSKRVGKWSVLGVGRGYQEGSEGASYAIATVTYPGRRKSIRLSDILAQLKELGEFARQHPELEFLCCVSGGGYCGWTVPAFQGMYKRWCREDPPPDNILLQEGYEFREDI